MQAQRQRSWVLFPEPVSSLDRNSGRECFELRDVPRRHSKEQNWENGARTRVTMGWHDVGHGPATPGTGQTHHGVVVGSAFQGSLTTEARLGRGATVLAAEDGRWVCPFSMHRVCGGAVCGGTRGK